MNNLRQSKIKALHGLSSCSQKVKSACSCVGTGGPRCLGGKDPPDATGMNGKAHVLATWEHRKGEILNLESKQDIYKEMWMQICSSFQKQEPLYSKLGQEISLNHILYSQLKVKHRVEEAV